MSTDSIAQLADLLDTRFRSNLDGQSSSKSNKYNQYEIIILAGICRAPGDPSTWHDLSLDALPDFWTKIRGIRGRNSCLRAFVEGYIMDTEMLTMIRNLSFLGDDQDKRWQSRIKGMSIWSLTPQNKSVLGKAIERRQRMIDYKDTADNHRPGDRADSAKLTKPDPNAPTDRMSLFKWVDHTGILLTFFFGPECPLVKEFKILTELLQDPEYFHNYTPINWAALTWKAHLDAQAFFDHKGVGSRAIALAQRTTLDVTSNYKFRADVLPLDHPMLLQARPPAGDPQGPSGIQWNLLEGGVPAGKCQKPNKWTTVRTLASAQGAPMVARLRPLINLRASMLWKTPDAIAQLLGLHFLALVPANRNPCL
jgi:hypothetical protein